MTPHNRYLSPDAPISGAFGVCGNNRSNISFVYSGINKNRHMKNLKLVAVVLVIAVIAIAVEYTDYIIYKSKYPNTEFWMWLVDDNK